MVDFDVLIMLKSHKVDFLIHSELFSRLNGSLLLVSIQSQLCPCRRHCTEKFFPAPALLSRQCSACATSVIWFAKVGACI